MSQKEKPVRSPCVQICVLNHDDICEGCYRSAEEITRWTSYSNEQRRHVLENVRERGKKLNPFWS